MTTSLQLARCTLHCMFLPLLCLGTILAPICPASCQPSCSLPPLSGSVRAAWFHPFTIRVGSRDEVVAVSHLKACMAADATPGSPRR